MRMVVIVMHDNYAFPTKVRTFANEEMAITWIGEHAKANSKSITRVLSYSEGDNPQVQQFCTQDDATIGSYLLIQES